MKYLAFDIGEKRIGLAISDESGIVARPLLTVAADTHFFEKIGEIIAAENPETAIFGLPRHQNGELGAASTPIKDLAEGIKHEFGLAIDFEDESGTSIEAERRLKQRGFDSKKIKEMVDAEAACVILEAYLART